MFFLAENIIKFLKYTKTNNHIIKQEKDKQLVFSLIYSLGLIELETLKTYIKINLINSFIWPFKFLSRISIFFN